MTLFWGAVSASVATEDSPGKEAELAKQITYIYIYIHIQLHEIYIYVYIYTRTYLLHTT